MPAFLRRLYRLSLILLLAVAGIAIELLIFPLISLPRRRGIIRQWSRALLAACGLQLRVHESNDAGATPLAMLAPGRMLIANHTSWLDIFAINAIASSAFVAKAELRRWPVAGWLAAMAGTVFIERSRRHAVHQVIEQLRRRIRERFPVAIFPEATTSAAATLLPFYGNLLEAAIAEEVEVIPLAIGYVDRAGGPAPAADYVGEITFLQSLWTVLGSQGLVAEVYVLDPVPTVGRHRHELARDLRGRVSAALLKPDGPLNSPTESIAPGTAAGFQAASR